MKPRDLMENYRKTYWCSWSNPINGIERTVHKIADDCQVDCKIEKEVKKTGLFSKEYEYFVIFTGEKESVEKAYSHMCECGDRFRINLYRATGFLDYE